MPSTRILAQLLLLLLLLAACGTSTSGTGPSPRLIFVLIAAGFLILALAGGVGLVTYRLLKNRTSEQ